MYGLVAILIPSYKIIDPFATEVARSTDTVSAPPGFRDHSIYKGKQVFLYKRAQILVGDLWGAFKGQGLGTFTDIESITMFADYLVPAVLREWGVLRYTEELSRKVDSQTELVPGMPSFLRNFPSRFFEIIAPRMLTLCGRRRVKRG